uniref:Uncharacterized protein n=1 Tax=Sinocyclocheilus anshuiensis TaxID=1608454 RepID=A0A671M868_9TELE
MPPAGSDGSDVNEENKPSKNIIAHISQFADDNLTFVRNISTCLGLVGLLIIARSIRLITKFGSAADIPARFIERNISIRGRLRNITEKGLEVEHIPIYVPLLSRLLTKRKEPLDPLLQSFRKTPSHTLIKCPFSRPAHLFHSCHRDHCVHLNSWSQL